MQLMERRVVRPGVRSSALWATFYTRQRSAICFRRYISRRVNSRIGVACIRSCATSLDPMSLEPAIRHLVSSMDGDIPVTQVRTMRDLLSLELSQPRIAMVLVGAFAGLALILTVVGLYGVMMYSVSRRTREISVRLALGAQRGTVLKMVLRDAATHLLTGIAIGLSATVASAFPAQNDVVRNRVAQSTGVGAGLYCGSAGGPSASSARRRGRADAGAPNGLAALVSGGIAEPAAFPRSNDLRGHLDRRRDFEFVAIPASARNYQGPHLPVRDASLLCMIAIGFA